MANHNFALELPLDNSVESAISKIILRTLYKTELSNKKHRNLFLFPIGNLNFNEEVQDEHFGIWVMHQRINGRDNYNTTSAWRGYSAATVPPGIAFRRARGCGQSPRPCVTSARRRFASATARQRISPDASPATDQRRDSVVSGASRCRRDEPARCERT